MKSETRLILFITTILCFAIGTFQSSIIYTEIFWTIGIILGIVLAVVSFYRPECLDIDSVHHKIGITENIRNKTKDVIDQYLKNRNDKYIENNAIITQFSSDEEYIKYKQKKEETRLREDQKRINNDELSRKIMELISSIPESGNWFKIFLFEKEFGISLQEVCTKTKKFIFDSSKPSAYLSCVYIIPWTENLLYNKENNSFLFYGYYYYQLSSNDIGNKYKVNEEQLDKFLLEYKPRRNDIDNCRNAI